MKVICIDLNDNVALFDTLLLVGHLLALFLFLIFTKENQAFTVTTWRDKHHMNHIFVFKLLVMGDFPHKCVLLIVSLLGAVIVNKVINKVSSVHDFLLSAAGLGI